MSDPNHSTLSLPEQLTAALFVHRINTTSIIKINESEKKMQNLYNFVINQFKLLTILRDDNSLNELVEHHWSRKLYKNLYQFAISIYKDPLIIKNISNAFDFDKMLMSFMCSSNPIIAMHEFSYFSDIKNEKINCILPECKGELKCNNNNSGCLHFTLNGMTHSICIWI